MKGAVMTDSKHRDQDRPIPLDNAASHRPPEGGVHSKHQGRTEMEGEQNADAHAPNPSQVQKQQRGPGMNHSG